MKQSVSAKANSRPNTKTQSGTYTKLKTKQEDTKKTVPTKFCEKENILSKTQIGKFGKRATTAMGIKKEETKQNPKTTKAANGALANNLSAKAPTGTKFGTRIKSPTQPLSIDRSKQASLNENCTSYKTSEEIERPKTAALKSANKTTVRPIISKPKPLTINKEANRVRDGRAKKGKVFNKTKVQVVKSENLNKKIEGDEIVTEEELKVYETLLKSGYTLEQVLISKEHCGLDLEKLNTCLQRHEIAFKAN